jgi:hypothetical protein
MYTEVTPAKASKDHGLPWSDMKWLWQWLWCTMVYHGVPLKCVSDKMPLLEPPGLHPAWSRAAGAPPLASRSDGKTWKNLIILDISWHAERFTQVHTGRYDVYIRYLYEKWFMLLHDSQVDLVQVQNLQTWPCHVQVVVPVCLVLGRTGRYCQLWEQLQQSLQTSLFSQVNCNASEVVNGNGTEGRAAESKCMFKAVPMLAEQWVLCLAISGQRVQRPWNDVKWFDDTNIHKCHTCCHKCCDSAPRFHGRL